MKLPMKNNLLKFECSSCGNAMKINPKKINDINEKNKFYNNDKEEKTNKSNNTQKRKYVKIKCDNCGQKMRLPEKNKLLKFDCPSCGKVIKINPKRKESAIRENKFSKRNTNKTYRNKNNKIQDQLKANFRNSCFWTGDFKTKSVGKIKWENGPYRFFDDNSKYHLSLVKNKVIVKGFKVEMKKYRDEFGDIDYGNFNISKLKVLNKETGKKEWGISNVFSNPFIWKNKIIVIHHNNLCAYNCKNGNLIWEFSKLGKDKSKINLEIKNDILYIKTSNQLYTVDCNGNQIWTFNLNKSYNKFEKSNKISNLYTFKYNQKIYTLNKNNGKPVWIKNRSGWNIVSFNGISYTLYDDFGYEREECKCYNKTERKCSIKMEN
ncbi:MAG: hypothetical protein ACOCP8_03030 [archaeon]